MCVTWHGMKALREKCNDMNHWSRFLATVICFRFVLIGCASPLALEPTSGTSLIEQLCEGKVVEVFSNFWIHVEHNQQTEVLENWTITTTLNVLVSLGWRAGPEERRMDGISWHVSIQKLFCRVMLVEKKVKLFIGLVPSVFLWNVIITPGGHIYCIHRQHIVVAGAYYLSIFSQRNIQCKHEKKNNGCISLI